MNCDGDDDNDDDDDDDNDDDADDDNDDDYLGPTPGGSLLANGFALSRGVGPVACYRIYAIDTIFKNNSTNFWQKWCVV